MLNGPYGLYRVGFRQRLQVTQGFCLAERESRARRTKGESVLGIYAGLGVSLLFALLFGRADRR